MRTPGFVVFVVVLAAISGVAGCYDPKLANGTLVCAASAPQCPDGYVCGGDNRCYAKGEAPGANADLTAARDLLGAATGDGSVPNDGSVSNDDGSVTANDGSVTANDGSTADGSITPPDLTTFPDLIPPGDLTFVPPPIATITSTPAAIALTTSSTFEFSADQANCTFRCRLDSGASVACTSPYTLSVPAGDHTFYVYAVNPQLIEGSEVSYSWTVDSVLPVTTITASPSSPSTSSTVTFEFTANKSPVTFKCRLDTDAFVNCTSPKSVTVADGTHTFEIYAVDSQNRTETPTQTFAWNTDTKVPQTTLSSAPSGRIASTTANFTFSADEVATFECSLDGAPFTATDCTSTRTYTGLAQGTHTFAVRAKDAAGLVDGSPASAAWTVDTVGPVVTVTGYAGAAVGATNKPSEVLTFTNNSSSDFLRYECKLDSAAFATCTSPYTLTMTLGAHTFTVRAVDDLLNVGTNKVVPITYTTTPLLYYPLDSATGTNSGSAAGYNAVVSNVTSASCKVGTCAGFQGAGSSIITSGAQTVLSADFTYTIAFWYNESAPYINCYVFKDRGFSSGFELYHGASFDTSLFSCGSTYPSGGGCSNFAFPTGWHHILIRYAGTAKGEGGGAPVQYYLDGANTPIMSLANSALNDYFHSSMGPDLIFGEDPVYAGTQSACGSTTKPAWIDDIKIYNRVFTPQEQCTTIINGSWNSTTSVCTLP